MAVLSHQRRSRSRLARSLSRACAVVALVAAALASSMPLMAHAESAASEAAVKAAFVYNFAKFTEWPAGAFATREAPLVLCIPAGLDAALAQAFGAVDGKSAQAHTIRLRRLARSDDLAACHIVYFGESEPRKPAEGVRVLAGKPVLTVSDAEGFAEAGGMIGLVWINERIQFEINVEATQQGGLNLSSQLLRLARIVKDTRTKDRR